MLEVSLLLTHSGSDTDWLQGKEGADQSLMCLLPEPQLILGFPMSLSSGGKEMWMKQAWNQREAELDEMAEAAFQLG